MRARSTPCIPRLHVLASLAAATLSIGTKAQSVGPNSPASGTNNTSIGANAWTSPGNVTSSDDTQSSTSTKGVTNYLVASNFGFTIPSPSGISGIQLDVERSASGVNNVAILDTWATGLARTLSVGTNRCLVVTYAQENGNGSRDITAMTYGGRSMTQLAEVAPGTAGGFHARLEVWILLEADLALASGTAIVPTYGAYTAQEYCEAFSSAVFQHVDQVYPVPSSQTSGAVESANPHQLSAAITTLDGSMAINLVIAGNNTTPGMTDGGTNTYTINSSYSEGTDLYFANTSVAPSTGACMQTAHKPITTGGTEQPSCTFNGSVNRWAMIAFALQRAREFDHAVSLMKGGVIGGSNLATTTGWPTTEGYASYGGATQLWGQSWLPSDVQATNFGASLSARVQNGTARVDHMRITVYYYSTLPVELLYFRAWPDGSQTALAWATASESNSSRFEVHRSLDGVSFNPILSVPAAGHSSSLLEYTAWDDLPVPGFIYYRLKQIDEDGSSSESHMAVVSYDGNGDAPFPNPTHGPLRIGSKLHNDSFVRVLNQSSQVVLEAPLTSEDPIVNLEGLAEGMYTILVFNGDEWSAYRAAKQTVDR